MNTNDKTLPSYVRPELAKVKPDLDLIADLLAGTRQMWEKAKSSKYIRKWNDEENSVYEIRSQCETVFEGLARVLSAAVGMLFAKAPTIEWNQSETAMKEQWANLDAAGTAGPVLCKRFAEQSLRDGIGIILVDHPPAPEGVVITAANEMALGLRPTWALYQRAQATNWRVGIVNNRLTVTQVTLEESTTRADGEYGIEAVTRYRTLKLLPTDAGYIAKWELKEEVKDAAGNASYVPVGQGFFMNRKGEVADFLPIAIAYTGRTEAPLCATIPLLGVAWANLSHWRLSTALTFAREVASYAQGVVIGELATTTSGNGQIIPGKVKLGPLALIRLTGENASFDWKAPPVEAFEPLERGIKEKLDQIGQMGMSFLVSDTRAAETATAKMLDSTAENSTLATAGVGVDDAWNLALEHHAWFLGIPKEGAPVLTTNKDFNNVTMDPQTMAIYIQAVVDAGLPPEYLVRAWIQGGRLPQDTDVDALVAEMMVNAQAAADAKAAELAAHAGDMGQGDMPPKQMAA